MPPSSDSSPIRAATAGGARSEATTTEGAEGTKVNHAELDVRKRKARRRMRAGWSALRRAGLRSAPASSPTWSRRAVGASSTMRPSACRAACRRRD
eukprot:scaffold297_cov108-Isochrysis_galbana.AAC.10